MELHSDGLSTELSEEESIKAKARFDYINQQLSSYEDRRAEFQKITEWRASHSYDPGDEVRHENRKYIKADDSDQSAPDDVAGGWTPA
jgi:hypothetical protein